MEAKIYKETELENKQTLVIWDLSRKIGADAYCVVMKAQIEVDIKKEAFEDPVFEAQEMTDIKFNDILSVLGDKVSYEYSVERNFTMAKDKESVFENLVDTFMKNLGQYVSKNHFPGKLILKQYKDKQL